ncbi:ERI1 exoribonuclease 2 [Pseudolycoriella hygida]|uniref:ERI1 exoribonuclease 2 n=1 Tax=Pseudolycoriella hygida TaxID=35572 RepID=A0A9Q0MJH7_9DIPT|nr:ERI1 exoribonuclease 2 [Pseudolycoriella hygida]
MNLLELARSLNIVETIKFSSGMLRNSKQNLKYVIVVDFEATCWKKGESPKWRQPEIIEFPAVLVDLSTQQILSEFHQYILPSECPKLSDFCINFTGITQELIDNNSVPLAAGLVKFGTWMNDLIDKFQLVLPNTSGSIPSVAFVTWTDWDFDVCLTKECKRKNIEKQKFFDQWIDLKATFKDWYKYRPKNFADALRFVGMKFEGREHSGIDDSRNIARLACRMVLDGAPLIVTKDVSPKCEKK